MPRVKKRKYTEKKTCSNDASIFDEENPKKKRKIYKNSKVMKDIGITNFPVENYVPSPLDKPELVYVKPVDILKKTGGFGLYASDDIPSGTCIGEYTGKFYSLKECDDYLKSTPNVDCNYLMKIKRRVVDALHYGNFTRYINFSDCQPNVIFVGKKLNRRMVAQVVTTRNMKKGEQFLVDYNIYNEEASKAYFFLNPEDSWQSGEEFYQERSDYYSLINLSFDLPFFDLKQQDKVYSTQIGKRVLENKKLVGNFKNIKKQIEFPYLKVTSDNAIKDFVDEDVFTPLMLACYLGNIDNVKWLIKHNANVNRQQNHSGNCPLFFALTNYEDTKNIKSNALEIIRLLIASGANILIHDRDDNTFLHKAVSMLNEQDFKIILDLIKDEKLISFYDLLSYTNSNDDDLFLLALRERAFGKIQILLSAYPDYFKDYLIRGKKDDVKEQMTFFMRILEAYSKEELAILITLLQEKNLKVNKKFIEKLIIKLNHKAHSELRGELVESEMLQSAPDSEVEQNQSIQKEIFSVSKHNYCSEEETLSESDEIVTQSKEIIFEEESESDKRNTQFIETSGEEQSDRLNSRALLQETMQVHKNKQQCLEPIPIWDIDSEELYRKVLEDTACETQSEKLLSARKFNPAFFSASKDTSESTQVLQSKPVLK